MSSFRLESIQDPDTNPFDRQQRIEWWSQEKISSARVLVVGAGATGNETLKNLALLGVKNILIADFDTVSMSNLSRTVLFRKPDMGKKKAEVAAQRTRELCLADDVRIDWFHGDVVWELGTGLYRYVDLVLGCLDNVETRFEVNRQCWLAETPWIDSGINQLGLHVTVYQPPKLPCYECSASSEQRIASRRRYSCDDFKRALLQEDKIPTVQVASAIASAIQVQEAMKLLCGQPTVPGRKIYYQGKIHDFDTIQLPSNPDCLAHVSYPEIIDLPIRTDLLLRDFLTLVSSPGYSGPGAALDFNAFRTFVVSTACRLCSGEIEFYRPAFRIFDTELVCERCKAQAGVAEIQLAPGEVQRTVLPDFSLERTPERVLKMSLHDLGVPYWPVLAVRDTAGQYRYYECSADREVLVPNMSV